MATEFNPKKALTEEIAGLVDVCQTLSVRLLHARDEFARAEMEFNTLTKLKGFADMELQRKRDVLAELNAQTA